MEIVTSFKEQVQTVIGDMQNFIAQQSSSANEGRSYGSEFVGLFISYSPCMDTVRRMTNLSCLS